MDGPRGRSNVCSKNPSRSSSAASISSSISSVKYVTRMEIQSEDPNWANQTDAVIFNIPLPSQVEGGSVNHVPANDNPQGPSTRVDLTSNSCSTTNQADLSPPSLSYAELQPADIKAWEGRTQPISIFGRMSTQDIDVNNIKASLSRILDFIADRQIKNNREIDIPCLEGFGKVAFKFIKSIYKGGWDNLLAGDGSKSFRDKIREEFTVKVPTTLANRKTDLFPPLKPVKFTNIPPPASLPRATNEGGSKSKSANKSAKEKPTNLSPKLTRTYAQASSANIRDILKLKENFPKLSDKKIEEIHKTVNNSNTAKPKINMTTKGPSRKQIIVPMSGENIKNFMATSNDHVININRSLRNIKSDIAIDFIRPDHKGLILVSNKVVAQSDIIVISNYIKNANNMNVNNIQDGRLPQSKSYLKILGLPYMIENTNTPMDAGVVENIIKSTHIFNDIKVASKPCVCKVSPKSDMAIVWVDVWDSQNGSSAKKIINRSFNVGSFIATVRGANMNPGVPQCKNCWKWGHTTFACHFQGSRCVKCNGPHKFEHHRHF